MEPGLIRARVIILSFSANRVFIRQAANSKKDNLSLLRVWGLPLRPSRQSWLGGLDCYIDVGIAASEGVVVGEDHVFGAAVAEGGFIVAADDGEGI